MNSEKFPVFIWSITRYNRIHLRWICADIVTKVTRFEIPPINDRLTYSPDPGFAGIFMVYESNPAKIWEPIEKWWFQFRPESCLWLLETGLGKSGESRHKIFEQEGLFEVDLRYVHDDMITIEIPRKRFSRVSEKFLVALRYVHDDMITIEIQRFSLSLVLSLCPFPWLPSRWDW
jgi:hypothetical protein